MLPVLPKSSETRAILLLISDDSSVDRVSLGLAPQAGSFHTAWDPKRTSGSWIARCVHQNLPGAIAFIQRCRYYLLAFRSAPRWLNTGDLVPRGRLAPHPRVGPVRATRDRLRYRLGSQSIIENYQARELRARLPPPSRSPRRAHR